MKLKKEYLILIVVIAALGLYLTVHALNQNNDQLPQPAKLEKAKIDRLVLINKKSPPLDLVKKDDHWFIEPQGYPADDAKIKNMINSVAHLKLTALVSESRSYERYGLSPDQKILVRAFIDGKVVRALSVGKTAPTHEHTFVQLDKDPDVYHARGRLVHTFDQTIAGLRDKTIFDVEQADLTAVTLKMGKTVLTVYKREVPQKKSKSEAKEKSIRKTTTEWQAADGRAVDQASMGRLLGEIDHLSCDAFAADDAKAKLGNPLWTITLKKGKEERSLSVHPKLSDKAKQLPATASTTKYVFLLNHSRVNVIEKDMDTLLGIKEQKK